MFFLIKNIVYSISFAGAINSFIDKGQRPEIFELTDNEVPIIRITLPSVEFQEIKQKSLEYTYIVPSGSSYGPENENENENENGNEIEEEEKETTGVVEAEENGNFSLEDINKLFEIFDFKTKNATMTFEING